MSRSVAATDIIVFLHHVFLFLVRSTRRARISARGGKHDQTEATEPESPKAADIGKRKDWPETKGMGRR